VAAENATHPPENPPLLVRYTTYKEEARSILSANLRSQAKIVQLYYFNSEKVKEL
jgi:hypothetical protein